MIRSLAARLMIEIELVFWRIEAPDGPYGAYRRPRAERWRRRYISRFSKWLEGE